MKYLGFLLFTALFFTACLKSNTSPEPDRVYEYLSFYHVQGPDTVSVSDTITYQIRVGGQKACYRLEGYEGQESAANQYDIRAVGSYPNPVLGDTLGCVGNYIKDTTVRFTPRGSGKQIFRFYNMSTLFRADTVFVR